MRRIPTLAVALGVAGAAFVTSIAPAGAAITLLSVDEVATTITKAERASGITNKTISDVQPDGDVFTLTILSSTMTINGHLVVPGAKKRVAVPFAPTGKIILGDKADRQVHIGLPAKKTHLPAQPAKDNTIVYQDSDGILDLAVRPYQDGSVRLNTVIHKSSAPKQYVHPLVVPAKTITSVDEDGVVSLTVSGSRVAKVTPVVARDAKGKAVPTKLEVRDSQLVQVVDHSSANISYPVTVPTLVIQD